MNTANFRSRVAVLTAALTGIVLLPASASAQAVVTIFSSYNFENISSAAAFYGDSSGNGHGLSDESFSFTSSNLATTGGNYAFDNSGGAPTTYAYDVNGGSIGQATNWGFELLIKNPGSNDTGVVNIFSVGHPNSNGLALYYDPVANQIYGSIGGGATFGNTAYVPGAWNSVALVNDGVSTTLWGSSLFSVGSG
jgi:hypothetical protein